MMHPPIAYDYVKASGFRCRNDNILIRWEDAPTMTPSGLVALPDVDTARPIDGRAAVVVAVGDGPSYESKCDKCGKPKNPFGLGVKPGDRVITDGRQIGERIYFNGVEHRVVREAELLAVVDGE